MESTGTLIKRNIRPPLICRVCGDVARGMNFDVITCMSCKAFFRRNALRRADSLQCQLDNHCVINQYTRGGCSACRLRKCLGLGMNADLIRSPYPSKPKQANSRFSEQGNNLPLPQPQPLSLLNHDRSMLSFEDWNLLSNIIHAYDEQNLAINTQYSLQKQSTLPPKVRSKTCFTLELIGSFYTAVQPLIERTNFFRHLSYEGRRLIIENNLVGIGTFNTMIAALEANVFDNPVHVAVCNEIYGAEYVSESYHVLQRLENNRILLKLLLFILTFASNSTNVVYHPSISNQIYDRSIFHTMTLIHIQNILVTMMWKYLLYQYGHFEAVKRFSLLVKNFLDTMKRMDENLSDQHWQMVDTLVQNMGEKLCTQA